MCARYLAMLGAQCIGCDTCLWIDMLSRDMIAVFVLENGSEMIFTIALARMFFLARGCVSIGLVAFLGKILTLG